MLRTVRASVFVPFAIPHFGRRVFLEKNMFYHRLAAVALAVTLLPLAASATTKVYSFNLSAAQQVPANTSPAAGSFQLTVDDVANTISYGMAGFNFQGAVNAAHIHKAMMGVNGPVQYDLLSNVDASGLVFAIPNSFGFSSGAKSVGLMLAGDINATPWNYYVNVHTTAFGGGEIRGQLAPVPEPASYALMAIGLGLMGVVARRRRAT
jgi:hypothetical protein